MCYNSTELMSFEHETIELFGELTKAMAKIKGIFIRPIRFLGIEWAPLIVPLKRRLETLAVVHFVFVWMILPILSTWSWYKNHPIWTHFADYFPLRVVKTADLPPDRNYIIGSHPHGVLSIGAFTAMLTSGSGFPDMFPGLKSTILTLNGQFWFPFRRDIGLALGGVESSRKSLQYLLENPGKVIYLNDTGRAIAIVLGGASEALDAHPGRHNLTLQSRRGFCRYALQYGADLVPMYNFGENDVYETFPNPRGTRMREIQEWIKNKWGICPPLMIGRGIFNYSYGILPHRRPITSVVGAPIRVNRVENPTEEHIDRLHSEYCKALIDLFETHKSLHDIPKDVHLNIQ
ncbi:diacylglycerol acyltransferase [Ancylostoma ceylanicum]|uniref:Acyltransferase n=1 Tax=Ancylostoma ceylanicum TaxID=53326 RepID=A0A0D6LFN4_9BILA|nr:diacylglycerol acyltransferase [Ancylostoma ceylanicum]